MSTRSRKVAAAKQRDENKRLARVDALRRELASTRCTDRAAVIAQLDALGAGDNAAQPEAVRKARSTKPVQAERRG